MVPRKAAAAARATNHPVWIRLQIFALLLVLAILVHGPSLGHPFLVDDIPLVQSNPSLALRSPSVPFRILRLDYWEGLDSSGMPIRLAADRSLYRPITSISFWLNAGVGPQGAAGFRVVNLLLHVGACFLTVLLLRVYFPGWISVAVGALLVIHPVSVDVVNRIVGRADILVEVGLLATLMVVTRAREDATRSDVGKLIAFTLLALGSKESGAIVPLLAGAAVWLHPSLPRANKWRLFLVVCLTSAAFAALRLSVVGINGPTALPEADLKLNPLRELGFLARLPAALDNARWYLTMLPVPVPLLATYRPDRLPHFPALSGVCGILWMAVGAALFGKSILDRKSAWRAPVLLGVLWWAGSFAVVGQLLFATGTYRDLRLLYPFMGSYALLLSALLTPWPRADLAKSVTPTARQAVSPFSLLAVALLMVTALVLSIQRQVDYRSERALFEHDVRVQPSALAHNVLGTIYIQEHLLDQALIQKQRAAVLAPNSTLALADLGGVYLELNQFSRADSVLKTALQLQPQNSSALVNLGLVRMRQNDFVGARASFAKAISANPDNLLPQLNLAVVEIKLGDETAARHQIEMLHTRLPGDPRVSGLRQLYQTTFRTPSRVGQ